MITHQFPCLLSFLAIIAASESESQSVKASLTNYTRMGSGRQIGILGEAKKEYLEHQSDVRLFVGEVTVGFRLQYDSPAEYGVPFSGIRKKFIEYATNSFNIRAGDLGILFGRGLTLNAFENRPLYFDSQLEGVQAEYTGTAISANVAAGDIVFYDYASYGWSAPRIERYTLRAASAAVSPWKEFSFGGSYVHARGQLPGIIPGANDSLETSIPELFCTLHLSSVDVFASYSVKRSFINEADNGTGSGAYISIGHAGEGYGVSFEYKDYRYDMSDPIGMLNPVRPTRISAFQYPPIGQKEHSYTLLSRYPHITDFNDEVGFQLDAYGKISDPLTLNVNGSAASRHFSYRKNAGAFTFSRKSGSGLFFPSFDGDYSPFWEIFLEGEYEFAGDNVSTLRVGFDRRSMQQHDFIVPSASTRVEQSAIPLQLQYAVNSVWSVKMSSEHQWVYDNHAFAKTDYYNHLLTLQFTMAPRLTFGGRWEITTSESEPQNAKRWIIAEISVRITPGTTTTCSYGNERGGQICSGGICRIVEPFNGFRFTLLSQL